MRQPTGLYTDLYQLTMAQAYLEAGMTEPASFEFFVRKLPAGRGFLVAAGLEQAVDYILGLSFDARQLDWLAETGRFSRDFIDHLDRFRFTGDVAAMQEGTVYFPDEPVVRVTAPLPQAQLLESRLINLLQYPSLIASKAARMVMVAGGRSLVDFGFRRAHGAEAGILAARAAYIAGFASTATVEAGFRYGIPVTGTMAHSFIQAHDSEREAFLRFARARKEGVVLLIDTYDTVAGARLVTEIAPILRAEGIGIDAVRLDSGDLGALARTVRQILDDAGLDDTRIVASGGLDEQEIARFAEAGAPIDGFGIGTSLATSQDAPAMDCAYKLQEYAGIARRKLSEGKATWPGRKQVFRRLDEQGRIAGDLIVLDGEKADGRPLLETVVKDGALVRPLPALGQLRDHAAAELGRLPDGLRRLTQAETYPVEVSVELRDLAEAVSARIRASLAQPG